MSKYHYHVVFQHSRGVGTRTATLNQPLESHKAVAWLEDDLSRYRGEQVAIVNWIPLKHA